MDYFRPFLVVPVSRHVAGGQSLLHVSLLEERSPISLLSLRSGSCPTLDVK